MVPLGTNSFVEDGTEYSCMNNQDDNDDFGSGVEDRTDECNNGEYVLNNFVFSCPKKR